jgi:hypothetical protein
VQAIVRDRGGGGRHQRRAGTEPTISLHALTGIQPRLGRTSVVATVRDDPQLNAMGFRAAVHVVRPRQAHLSKWFCDTSTGAAKE